MIVKGKNLWTYVARSVARWVQTHEGSGQYVFKC